MSDAILFDGKKSVNLLNNPEAWTSLSGGSTAGDVQKYYKAVPLIWRGVDLIANSVSSLPFAIVNDKTGVEIDTSDDYQNALGFMPNPRAWRFLIAASMELLGKGYLFREQNRVKVLGLRYVLASSISPIIDEKKGLIGFERQLSSGKLDWSVDDVVYFWGRDPFVEIGPPAENKCPVQAALMAAGVLYNLAEFAALYFERGAIKPTVLQFGGKTGQAAKQERERLESWWSRVMAGVKNAFTSKVISGEVTATVLGEGLSELSDSNLTQEQREDVLTALGIPITIIYSNQASGIGGGSVVSGDEKGFYERKVVPASAVITDALNEQLLVPLGYRWVDRPETLDVFQTDENQRSQSFERYVNTGIRLSVAAQMLGLELPEGIKYEDLDTMKEEDREAAAARMPDFGGGQNPQQNPQNPQRVSGGNPAMRADLRRWERKALNKGPDCEFESEFIPDDVRAAVLAGLALATTDEEVKAAFSGPFPEAEQKWTWDYP